MLKKEDMQIIDDVVSKFNDKKSSLITILQDVQDIYRYLSEDVLEYVSEATGVTPSKVFGVATFYENFSLEPKGEYEIRICDGTACHVNGSKKLEAAISKELNIKNGETTEDKLFTMNNVACLGCCSLAPVMMINDETYGNITGEEAAEIVREIKSKHVILQEVQQ